MRIQLLFGLSCLSALALGDGRDLFRTGQFGPRNNASSASAEDLFGINVLEKRQSTCPSGSGLCEYSGRCCPDPSDACCEDGTCVQRSSEFCCGGGGACPHGRTCCEGRCNPGNTSCCRDGSYCDADEACIIRDSGDIGCCPSSGCYEAWQVIYWYYYVYWYVYIYIEVTVEVTTSTLSLTSSRETTSTTTTITASNSASASSIFEDLSSSLSSSAATTPDLSALPTSTTTSTSSTTSTTTSTSSTRTDDFDEPISSTFDPAPTDSDSDFTGALPSDDSNLSGGLSRGSISSAHSLWAYIGVAVLSFIMMVAL